MACAICGGDLDAAGNCPRCASPASPPPPPSLPPPLPSVPQFLAPSAPPIPVQTESQLKGWQAAGLAILAVLLCALVLLVNYQRALHWAGVMNPKAIGYMVGGCFVAFLLGTLVMFVVEKARRKKSPAAIQVFGISAFAFFFSLMAIAPEAIKWGNQPTPEAKKQVGTLLKEAAGKQPKGKDVNWWDGPSRDFFHDMIERNQQYIAEVQALDSSAIKDLYSINSYSSKNHMEKVVSQLRATEAVEQKYASLEPLIKALETRVAAANTSEAEKQEFLKSFKAGMNRVIVTRTELIGKEMAWMDTTIDLYDFTIAHSSAYSIRSGKLFFKDDSAREEFTSRQSKAIALHKEFLKAKADFEQSRKNNLDQLGVSSSDLTPSQLGKLK